MKKIIIVLLSLVLLLGCEKATYKEGVFNGSAVDTYGGENNTATAKITINEEGKITDVYIDTTYTKDGISTTKKTLGKDYGMKKGNSSYGSADYEWYEQIEALEKAIIENQGIDFLNIDEDGYTDAVSTCTIKIDAIYKALTDALNKAK